eukprot:COSAG06_NODE_21021_length_773_cov_0.465875_1_plen_174_part_01
MIHSHQCARALTPAPYCAQHSNPHVCPPSAPPETGSARHDDCLVAGRCIGNTDDADQSDIECPNDSILIRSAGLTLARDSSLCCRVCELPMVVSQDRTECVDCPCVNGACVERGYTETVLCECSDGWEGFRCNRDVDECFSAPCQNGGTCSESNSSSGDSVSIDSFRCDCAGGI